MKLQIDKEDMETMSVDRDSTRNRFGTEGFSVFVGGLEIHFEDEYDAARLAAYINRRLGIE